MQTSIPRLAMAAICFCSPLALLVPEAAAKKLEILATTFPIYQITRNITAGSEAVKVDLMIPAQMGCPHDYALVPRDMQKLAQADILVINGLGMEEFLGAPVKKANAKIKIVDSSAGIRPVLQYADEDQGHQDKAHGHKHDNHDHHDKAGHAEKEADHHPEGTNTHLFASPRMVSLLAKNIAAALGAIDREGAPLYEQNARIYSERMEALANDFSALGKRLRNNRIITQHGVFDYLARDMGLEIVAVVQAHAGQEPAASDMLAIIETAKRDKAGAIFTEPQYPEAVAKTIAKEAGIPTATLDPVANGPEQAPLDYYQTAMRNNLTILEQTLGTQ